MVLSGKSKRLVVSRSNLCTMNSEKCMLGRGKGGKGKGKAGKYYYKRSTMMKRAKLEKFLLKTNKVSIDETLFLIDYYRIL